MDESLEGRIRGLVVPVVRGAGFFCEKVTLTGSGTARRLTVVVDLDGDAVGSVDSDQLGRLSQDLSSALDGADIIPERYTLEVSTPGAGRPLTEVRHWRRARTRLVEARTTSGEEFTARVQDVDETGVAFRADDGTERHVPHEHLARGVVVVELRRGDPRGRKDVL